MRRTSIVAFALFGLMVIPAIIYSQGGQSETSRSVEGGGIKVPGWQGQVDAKAATAGASVNSAGFVKEGDGFKVTTGPAITYWNPSNKASGDYTVKATFTEPKYMNLNSPPHPYGIVI